MPYTRITSTKNVSACIEYMRGHGHGHNSEEVRNQYVSGIGLLNDGAVPFDVQMGWTLRHRNSRNKVDAFRVIQGFGPEELDADNPEDVFLAHQIGLDLAEKMWPGHQVAVFTQTDGKGHKVHNHLVVCNVNTETHKGCDRNSTLHAHIKEKSDEICGHFFEIKESEPVKDKVSQTVRVKREKNAAAKAAGLEPTEYIWQDDLKARIKSAVGVSRDMDELYTELVKRGVEMDVKKPTKKHPEGSITYELTDVTGFDGKIPRNLKSRASRLGTDYDLPTITRMLEINRVRDKAYGLSGIQSVIEVGNALSNGGIQETADKPTTEGIHTEKEAVNEPEYTVAEDGVRLDKYGQVIPIAEYESVWNEKRQRYRSKEEIEADAEAEADAYYEKPAEQVEPVVTPVQVSEEGSDEGQEVVKDEMLTVSDEELDIINKQIEDDAIEVHVGEDLYTAPMTREEVSQYMTNLLVDKFGFDKNNKRSCWVLYQDFNNWRYDRREQGIDEPIAKRVEGGKYQMNIRSLSDQIALYYAAMLEEAKQRELKKQGVSEDSRSAEAKRKKREAEARRRLMMQTLTNDARSVKDGEMQKE